MREADVRIRTLEWRVIVTLDGPEDYGEMIKAVDKLKSNNVVQISAYWSAELAGLENRLQHIIRTTRRRRGLIDGVGVIAHSLFGMATDSDVDEVKAKVEENRRALKEVTHWSREWTTVVNATYQLAKTSRQYVRNLTVQFADYTQVNQGMVELRAALHDAERRADERQRIKDDLEDGRLTETIFPKEYFTRLQTMEDWIEPREWYYSYVRVHPLWGNNAFVARLPLVGQKKLLSYELETFPVFTNDTTVELLLPELVVRDTETGDVEEPRHCVGRNPKVCNPGPVYRASCAAAVINNGTMHACQLAHSSNKELYVLGVNDVVRVSRNPAMIHERCPKQGEQTTHVPAGTVRVQWGRECNIEFPDFKVHGVQVMETSITARVWQSPKLNTDFDKHLINVVEIPNVVEIGAIPSLTEIPDIRWKPSVGTIGQWVSIAVICGVICLILAYLIKTRHRCLPHLRSTTTGEDRESLDAKLMAFPLVKYEANIQEAVVTVGNEQEE